jgi:hypothetical protein
MYIATCFDTKELSSGYSMNHNIDTSSDSVHFGIPKSLHRRIQVKNNFTCIFPCELGIPKCAILLDTSML